jgi:molybdopterin-guanine dinucleotide biosynthesis protein A
MGRDKPWLPWRGQPVLGHVVERLARAVDEVLVVSAPGQVLPATKARRVEDHEEGLGPLAGLRAGLAASPAGLAFVTAADAPFLTPAFVTAVLARGAAAAPEAEGRVQTLAAAYPAEAWRDAQALLAEGKRRPLDLLERIGFERLDLGHLPDPDSVRGFNTPAEYLAAVRADAPGGLARLRLDTPALPGGESPARPVPVGTLAEILRAAGADADLLEGDRLAAPYVACLDGRCQVRDARIPIGAGEEIRVLEESHPNRRASGA